MVGLEIITNYITDCSVSRISESLDEINLALRKKEDLEESEELEEDEDVDESEEFEEKEDVGESEEFEEKEDVDGSKKIEENEVSDKTVKNAEKSSETDDNIENSKENKTASNNELLEKASNLKEEWKNVENKLAYFGEHDELEKIGYAIAQLEENIRNEEFDDALLNNIESKFWLNHFKEKDSFTLKNIF